MQMAGSGLPGYLFGFGLGLTDSCLPNLAPRLRIHLHRGWPCFAGHEPPLSNRRLAPLHPCLPTAIGNKATFDTLWIYRQRERLVLQVT